MKDLEPTFRVILESKTVTGLIPMVNTLFKLWFIFFGHIFSLGKGGSYWNVDPADKNAILLGPSPAPFSLEFQGRSKLCIRAPNGKYLKSEQNGIFSASADEGGSANTFFEF